MIFGNPPLKRAKMEIDEMQKIIDEMEITLSSKRGIGGTMQKK